jgi:hypothetical protein
MQWEVPDRRVLVELQTSMSARNVVPGEPRSDNWIDYPKEHCGVVPLPGG